MANIKYQVENVFLPMPEKNRAKRFTQRIKEYLLQKDKLQESLWEREYSE